MRPNEVREWQRILRDFAVLAVGIFILVYETVGTETPNEWLIGAALSAIGLVPIFRREDFGGSKDNRGGKDDEK